MVKAQLQEQGSFPRLILIAIIFLFIVNTAVIALAVGLLDLPGELSPREQARQGALFICDYVQEQAENAGVAAKPAVREVLARFRFEVEQATRREEIAQLVLKYGREAQDIILREQENQRRELALALVRQDPQLQEMLGEGKITISWQEETGIVIQDPANLLSPETREKIRQHEGIQGLSQMVEIQVVDGKAELVTPISMLESLKRLEHEVDSLRLQLQESRIAAGTEPMTGAGIVLRLYDAEMGTGAEQIVHDFDIRDIVNELFAAGAAGIAVNDQRLVATSSIRCAGPVILVNHKPIAVNPVTIRAIGDPEVLTSSLDLIRAEYEFSGIRFEVEPEEKITLPAYDPK
ncbi:MAG TPA: DUF881 domain-containing protein [Firmicutes bacterium]|nr:DUF881 domain-containing protein [Bacillota bacterium]